LVQTKESLKINAKEINMVVDILLPCKDKLILNIAIIRFGYNDMNILIQKTTEEVDKIIPSDWWVNK
jgi:hypothetical protein